MNKKRKEEIERSRLENIENEKGGNVVVAKKPHYRSKGDKRHPRISGYMNIDVTSGTNSRFRQLSPMILGPTLEKPRSQNMENLWQFSKVFKGDVDSKGRLTMEFFERRNRGFADNKAHRRVKSNDLYLYHYWNGKKLTYIKAREEIYVKNYSDLVKESPVYKELEALLEEGYNLQIIGYDGREYNAASDNESKLLNEWLRDLSKPFGHELVLAALLTDKQIGLN